jgi:hypothetical protein
MGSIPIGRANENNHLIFLRICRVQVVSKFGCALTPKGGARLQRNAPRRRKLGGGTWCYHSMFGGFRVPINLAGPPCLKMVRAGCRGAGSQTNPWPDRSVSSCPANLHRLTQVSEERPDLPIEIAGKRFPARIGGRRRLAGEPYGAAALGHHGPRISVTLRESVLTKRRAEVCACAGTESANKPIAPSFAKNSRRAGIFMRTSALRRTTARSLRAAWAAI